MKQLLTIVVPRIAVEWDIVAYCLEFDRYCIGRIRQKYGGNPEKCCYMLLEKWISTDQGSTPKSWTTLLSAFQQLTVLTETGRKIEEDLKV